MDPLPDSVSLPVPTRLREALARLGCRLLVGLAALGVASGACAQVQVLRVASGGNASAEMPCTPHAPVRWQHKNGEGAPPLATDRHAGSLHNTAALLDSGVLPDPAMRPLRAPLPDTVPKLAIWGDSHTAAGSFVDGLAEAYQENRDKMLPTFIAPTFGNPGVRLPLRKACLSADWKVSFAHDERQQAARYGRGLVAMSSSVPGSSVAVDFRWPQETTRLRWLNVHYSRDQAERSLVLAVSVNNGPDHWASLSRAHGNVLQIQSIDPIATVRLRLVVGQITLEGFAPTYKATPALVVDNFSLPGATARDWLAVSAEYLKSQSATAATEYDRVLWQYGTNEGVDEALDYDAYTKTLRASLAKFRSVYARAECILIGPPDRGDPTLARSAAAGPGFSERHKAISVIQRQVGNEFGCAFWDWQAAMGGIHSARRWEMDDRRLMRADRIHLTPKGYQVSGRLFDKAFPMDKRPVASASGTE
jgi:lysophospholipase L1-like esterase